MNISADFSACQYQGKSYLPDMAWQWGDKKYLMAVVNATPDSFSGDGVYGSNSDGQAYLIDMLCQKLRDGADILDIGAESTRPGSKPISAEMQIMRLKPIFSALQVMTQAGDHVGDIVQDWCVSIDTSDPQVAEWGLLQGVAIINDVQGGKDTDLLKMVAKYDAKIVLMHNSVSGDKVDNLKELGKSYAADTQMNIVDSVISALNSQVQKAINLGVKTKNIIVDPGIGFGKTVADNLRLIRHCDLLVEQGFPLLVGASRKSFIGKILNLKAHDRLEASLMVHGQALMGGASIIRVHDVVEHHRICKMAEALSCPERFDNDDL